MEENNQSQEDRVFDNSDPSYYPEQPEPAQDSTPDAPVEPAHDAQPSTPPPFPTPMLQAPKRNGVPVWAIVLLSIVGVACVAFVILWCFYLKSQKDAVADTIAEEEPATEVVEVVPEEVVEAEPVETGDAAGDAAGNAGDDIPWTEKRAEKRNSSASGNQYSQDAYVCNDEYRYPIRVEYTLRDDGRVTGRYAYASTIRKYGDKPANWFKISGTYDKTMGAVTMNLNTYLYGKSEPFENMRVRVTSSGMRGTLTNCSEGTRLDIEP